MFSSGIVVWLLMYTNPQLQVNAVWRVDLQPADANSHLIVWSTGDVTVQYVVNQGKGSISETAVAFVGV